MAKSNNKIVVISILDNSEKKSLLISTPEIMISILSTKEVDIAMISANAYSTACKLKKARVFAVSIKDLEYQREKGARPETNPKTVIPEEYYNLLDVFSKKNLDTLLFRQKYDHKIIVEEE